MKKYTLPKHFYQYQALEDIKTLFDAAEEIHRATDGDGVWSKYTYENIGWDCHAGEWTEKVHTPDIKSAIDTCNWILYGEGKCWAEHCGPLKKAFRDIVREAKKRLTETDWTPCTCKHCKKHNKHHKK